MRQRGGPGRVCGAALALRPPPRWGLTVQLTPIGEWLQLYVVERSTTRIVVREATGRDGRFDYLVQGVRKGYEDYRAVREAGER